MQSSRSHCSAGPRVYLIDVSIYFFKYYFALPDHWWSVDGNPTAAAYGYGNWLKRFLSDVQPQWVAACFDESLTTCFRNEIYPDYKCSRVLPDELLAFQLEASKQLTAAMGVPCYSSNTHEADDLIGTLAARAAAKGIETTILSRDKDLGQLLHTEEAQLWDYPDGNPMHRPQIHEKLGVWPEQVVDLLALMGDAGDDIPGVPGVGPKTAAQLLAHLSSWEQIKADIRRVETLPIRGAKGLAKKLTDYRDQIDIAYQLARIDCAAPLGRRYTVKRSKASHAELKVLADALGFPPGFAEFAGSKT